MRRLQEHGSVLFEGERLPLVGMPVIQAKAMLMDAWNIPYFAEAIVNGRQVPVAHVLRKGDRLEFVQRFGVKANDDKSIEEAIGEALVIAYPELLERASKVRAMNLPADRSREFMTGMVVEWVKQRFGPPGASRMSAIVEIGRRLQGIEAVVQQALALPGSRPADLTDTEEFILEALGNKTMKAAAIARAGNLKQNTNLKTTLSHLVKRGILLKNREGYFRNPES